MKSTPMKIASVDVFLLGFSFKSVFVLAGGVAGDPGTLSHRVLVKITSDCGAVGWGEATPTPRWTYETSETIVSTLRRYLAPAVIGIELWNFDALHRAMERAIQPGVTTGSPLAKSAIDVAAHDALGHALGVPVYQLLGGCRRTSFDLMWMISVARPDAPEADVAAGLDAGYRHFDVKIGMHGEAGDLGLVTQTRQALGDHWMQVDANRGYRIDAALRQSRRFAELGVALFEQPLNGFNLAAYRRLCAASPVGIGIDESLRSVADLLEYARADAIGTVVAKVQRNAGLYRSRQLCDAAEAAGLELSLSGLTETDLGLAAGLHLAAAFDINPLALNGPQYIDTPFLRKRVWRGGGQVQLPDGPGLGVSVDEAWVRDHALELAP
ncbi:MAG: mandelate racemase [Gammaproteobacteria bacterium]|nr:mandelate racemase [Gammaproteobacteria bacterium]MBU1440084.1 mandelate racemase [Gammaproteobacteria bacterium]MBU2286197.1 mandelate racemase [Gammaproteobacteria bacterium]